MSAKEQTLSSLNDIIKFQRQNQREHFVATCGQCQPGDTELKSDDREAETVHADSQGSESRTKTTAIGSEGGLEQESSSNKTAKRPKRCLGINYSAKKMIPVVYPRLQLTQLRPQKQPPVDVRKLKRKKGGENMTIASEMLWGNTASDIESKALPLFDGQVPPEVVVVSTWNNEVEVVTSEAAEWEKGGVDMEGLPQVDKKLKIGVSEEIFAASAIWNQESTTDELNSTNSQSRRNSYPASFMVQEKPSDHSSSCRRHGRRKVRSTNWTQDDLEKAILDIRDKGMSLRKAAALHGIPKSSLGDRLSGKKKLSGTIVKSHNQIDNSKRARKNNIVYPRGASKPDIQVCRDNSVEKIAGRICPRNEEDPGSSLSQTSPVVSIQEEIVTDQAREHESNKHTQDPSVVAIDNHTFVTFDGKENDILTVHGVTYETDKQSNAKTNKRRRSTKKNQRPGSSYVNGLKRSNLTMSELGEAPAKRLNRFDYRVTMSDDIREKTSFKAKLKSWSQTDMENAIKDVTEHGMSIRQAAVNHRIPKSSLADRICRRKDNADLGKLLEQLRPIAKGDEDLQALKDLENGKKSPKSVAKQFGISFSFLRKALSSNRNETSSKLIKTNSQIAEEINLEEVNLDNSKDESSRVAKFEGERSKDTKSTKCRKERMRWKRDNLLLAMNAVKDGKMSLRGSAKFYGIPKSTLGDIIKGKCSTSLTPGPKRLLSEEEENSLAGWLITMERSGRHVRIKEVLETVKAILDNSGKQIARLKDNLPKESWWYGFLLRHKEVAEVRKHFKMDSPSFVKKENLQLKDKHKTYRKRREISTKDNRMDSVEGDCTNDNQSNDGFFCAICDKPYRDGDAEEIWISCGNVSDDGIVTDGCGGWSHLGCSNLAPHNLSTKELESVLWHCPRCVKCYLSEANTP
ncbi:uncharacterized protein LOC135695504 isoform X2 [Rhopilema esculentum]|eukprot:gene11460-21668_t